MIYLIFLGFMLIIIYIGAIVILFLFIFIFLNYFNLKFTNNLTFIHFFFNFYFNTWITIFFCKK